MRTLSAEAMITELLPCPHQLWPHKGTLKERNASWAFCKALLESTLVRSIVTAHCSPAVLQRDCHPLSERSWLYWHASATIPLLTASSVLSTLGPYSKTSIWTPFEHPIAAPELRK